MQEHNPNTYDIASCIELNTNAAARNSNLSAYSAVGQLSGYHGNENIQRDSHSRFSQISNSQYFNLGGVRPGNADQFQEKPLSNLHQTGSNGHLVHPDGLNHCSHVNCGKCNQGYQTQLISQHFGNNIQTGTFLDMQTPIYNPLATPHYEVSPSNYALTKLQNLGVFESAHHNGDEMMNIGAGPYMSPNPYCGINQSL